MSRQAFSVFLVLALILILSSITASAQQPRAVPSNDNFVDADTLQIGKSYSVPDIGAATNEGGEPGALCKYASGPIPHSVWFRFTLPELSYVSLSTFGTLLLEPDHQSIDTVLAVYELTGVGVFTERACSEAGNGTPAAQLVFAAAANVTYYIAVGTSEATDYLPESTLKLTTRLLYTTIRAANHTFETPISSDDWILKNGGDDQVVCDNLTYPALQGDCTFRFVGTPGVTTKLTHKMSSLPFAPRKNAFLGAILYFRIVDTASLGTTKVKLIVTYSDGTPPSVQTVNLTGRAATTSYEYLQFTFALKSGKVASLKFMVKFGSSTGGLLVDYLNYYYHADPGTRGSVLLPVPVPPAAK